MADGQRMADGSSSDVKSKAAATPKTVTIAGTEGIPPIYSELGEPISNPSSQNPKLHRASRAKRLSGRLDRPSYESIPRFSSHGLTKSPGLLPIEDSHAGNDQRDPNDPHGLLLSQVSRWLHDEKAKVVYEGGSKESSDISIDLQKLEKILAEHSALGKHASKSLEKDGHRIPKHRSSLKKLTRVASHLSDTEYYDGEPIIPSTDVILDNSKIVGYTDDNDRQSWLEFKNEIIRLTHTLRLKGWRKVPLNQGADIEVQRVSGALTNAVYIVTPPKALPEGPPSSQPSDLPKRRPLKLLLRVYGPQASHLIDRAKELEILKRLAEKRIGPRLLGTFDNGRFEQYLNASPLTPKDLRDPEVSKQIAKRMRELHDGIELTLEERRAGPLLWQNWDKWVKRCEEVISWLDEQVTTPREMSESKTDVWRMRGFVCGVPWASFRKAVDNYRKWLEEKYGGKKGLRDNLLFAHNDAQYGNILRIEPTGESPLLLPANEHKQLVVIDFEYANANTPGLEFANHFTEWCYNYHASVPWACNVAAYPHPEEQRRFIRAYVQHRPALGQTASPLGPVGAKTGSSSTGSRSSLPKLSLGPCALDAPSPPMTALAASKLDPRMPSTHSYAEEEKAREEAMKRQIERLVTDTRLWRVANSAQWVAWGIVQAKVEGMERALEERRRCAEGEDKGAQPSTVKGPVDCPEENPKKFQDLQEAELDLEASRPPRDHNLKRSASPAAAAAAAAAAPIEAEARSKGIGERAKDDNGKVEDEDEKDEGSFDYLAYAQDRALFFWGDLLEMGLVKEEELPTEVVKRAKRIGY